MPKLHPGFLLAAFTLSVATALGAPVKPRARIIVDNDFGGDPDGLFQLAQHVLSPSVEVRGVIGSRNYPGGFYGHPDTARYAAEVARELLRAARAGSIPVCAGAESGLRDEATPNASDGARLIVQEALRDDARPLYVACGAGLTEIASAYLLEPRIAGRLTLVWIGGPEYAPAGQAKEGESRPEYNLGIDAVAARVIFNRSPIPLWQVPRDAYRQALVSTAELRVRIGRRGPLGRYLLERMDDLTTRAAGSLGEAYVLGDSPLVLLTALQSAWEPDAASSAYVSRAAPTIDARGMYDDNAHGRPIRVYVKLDTRLMFEDLYAKIAEADPAATH